MYIQPSAGGLIFAVFLSHLSLCPEAKASFVARYIPKEPARQTTTAVVQSRWICRCSPGARSPRRGRNYSLKSGAEITEEQVSDCGDVRGELPSPTSNLDVNNNEEILRRDDEASTSIPPPSSSIRMVSNTKAPNLRAYWDILRPQNIPASFGLVAAGALAASHTTAAVLDPKVRIFPLG